MGSFKIVFAGLMCHAKTATDMRTAVIVRDGNHQPRLWVSVTDLLDSNFNEEPSPDPDWRAFRIRSDARIHFSNLAGGPAAVLPFPDVPRVTDFIPRFVPLDEMLATQRHNWVRAYVEYSGGNFEVLSYYPQQIRFQDTKDYECRAQALVWTTDSSGDVTIHDVTNNRTLTVREDSLIGITQLDKDSNAPGDHRLYRHLSKTQVGVLDIDLGQEVCQKGIWPLPEAIVTSATVECTSSQWP